MIFAANGEYLVSGGVGGLRVWRVQDGKQMAAMKAPGVRSVAVSKDGGWIAAGTFRELIVWDAKTYKQTFTLEKDHHAINGVDFSPDSTHLVSALDNRTVTVWSIATRQRVLTLHHESAVTAAKFSLQGDRIATATRDHSVRVYDRNDGRLLVDITVKVTPRYNNGLLWSGQQLFVRSDTNIKQIDASNGSVVSGLLIPGDNDRPIALPKHGEFIALSARYTVVFWDTLTRAQLGLIQHAQGISSIALSPDDQFIAIGGQGGKITVKCLYRIFVSIVNCCSVVYLNDPLASIVFSHKTQSLCLHSTPLSRNQTFGSRWRTLFSICGSAISSRTRKRY